LCKKDSPNYTPKSVANYTTQKQTLAVHQFFTEKNLRFMEGNAHFIVVQKIKRELLYQLS